MPYDPFCKGKIYEEVFLETEHFFAVPNLHPILPGHTIVAPKRHVLLITELSGEEMADLGSILGRLLPKLLEEYGTDSYNIVINSGETAGMSVEHMHLHVVPRRGDDVFRKAWADAFQDSLEKGAGRWRRTSGARYPG